LLAYQNTNVVFGEFDVLTSVNVLLVSVIGGVGYVSGTVFGAIGNPGGPSQEAISHLVSTGNWYLLVAGLLTIVVLIINPDGIVSKNSDQLQQVRRALGRPSKPTMRADVPASQVARVVPKRLEVEDIQVSFGGVRALDGVSLELEPGKVVGLIGPNGAGKTTLIDVVSGFNTSYQGRVKLDGVPMEGQRASQRARAGISRSFQSLELFEDLSVAENLRTAVEPIGGSSFVTDLFRPGRLELPLESLIVVSDFRLGDCLTALPSDLPNAQRRLVAIARAVVGRPSVLLLDEPAAGLDKHSTEELSDLIRKLARDWGMAILLIEHDVSMVLSTCDEVVVLDFGCPIARGTPQQIRHDEAVIKAYLGASRRGDTSFTAAVGDAEDCPPISEASVSKRSEG
jgi:sulfate-transporting ATPase